MTRRSFDPDESLGQLNFRLYYGEVLRQALQQARDGVLEPQWCENVVDSSRLSGLQFDDPYGVRLSVVTASMKCQEPLRNRDIPGLAVSTEQLV